MIEIERKFLVQNLDFKNKAISKTQIIQGFLNTHPERTVRVRLKGINGFITVKGKSNASGTTRFEWEREITQKEAENLLELCEPGVLHKTRYEVPYESHVYEVDEFHGANNGLIVAEVELASETETFKKPPWLGVEVTGDVRYYNSQLSKKPYNAW